MAYHGVECHGDDWPHPSIHIDVSRCLLNLKKNKVPPGKELKSTCHVVIFGLIHSTQPNTSHDKDCEIGVLLELCSHGLCYQEEIWRFECERDIRGMVYLVSIYFFEGNSR